MQICEILTIFPKSSALDETHPSNPLSPEGLIKAWFSLLLGGYRAGLSLR